MLLFEIPTTTACSQSSASDLALETTDEIKRYKSTCKNVAGCVTVPEFKNKRAKTTLQFFPDVTQAGKLFSGTNMDRLRGILGFADMTRLEVLFKNEPRCVEEFFKAIGVAVVERQALLANTSTRAIDWQLFIDRCVDTLKKLDCLKLSDKKWIWNWLFQDRARYGPFQDSTGSHLYPNRIFPRILMQYSNTTGPQVSNEDKGEGEFLKSLFQEKEDLGKYFVLTERGVVIRTNNSVVPSLRGDKQLKDWFYELYPNPSAKVTVPPLFKSLLSAVLIDKLHDVQQWLQGYKNDLDINVVNSFNLGMGMDGLDEDEKFRRKGMAVCFLTYVHLNIQGDKQNEDIHKVLKLLTDVGADYEKWNALESRQKELYSFVGYEIPRKLEAMKPTD